MSNPVSRVTTRFQRVAPAFIIICGAWFVMASVLRISLLLQHGQDLDPLPFISIFIAVVMISLALAQLQELQRIRAELEVAARSRESIR